MDLYDLRGSYRDLVSALADTISCKYSLDTFMNSDRSYLRVAYELSGDNTPSIETIHSLTQKPEYQNVCWVPMVNDYQTAGINDISAAENKIPAIVTTHDVVLFMHGTPEEPFCGESRRMSKVLQETAIDFYCVNILSDDIKDMAASFSLIEPPMIYYKRLLLHPRYYQDIGLDALLERLKKF